LKLALLTLLAIVFSTVNGYNYTYIHAPGYCAMYKECGESTNPLIPGMLNCPYNGPAIDVSFLFYFLISSLNSNFMKLYFFFRLILLITPFSLELL